MSKVFSKPTFPQGIDLQTLPQPVQDFIIDIEDYATNMQEHKAYYRMMFRLICTGIYEHEFHGATYRDDARALLNCGGQI